MEGLVDLLGEDPRLSPDIYFRVTEEVIVNGVLKKKTELVGAHKFVLSMLSDVFKTMFFGPMRDENEVIHITETTIEAFKEFLKILYSLHTSSCETSVVEVKPLFEILNLCKRYIVQPAVTLIEEKILSMELPTTEPEKIIPAIVVANDYKELVGFETISETFLQCCSAFLNGTLRTAHQVRQFLARVEARFSAEILTLMVRLLSLTDCSNCKAPQCLNGCQVTRENMVENAKVKAWLRPVVVGYNDEEGLIYQEREEPIIVGKLSLLIESLNFIVITRTGYESDVLNLAKDEIHFECHDQTGQ